MNCDVNCDLNCDLDCDLNCDVNCGRSGCGERRRRPEKSWCIGMATATEGVLCSSLCPFLYLPLFLSFSASLPLPRPFPSFQRTLLGSSGHLTPSPTPPIGHTVRPGDTEHNTPSSIVRQLVLTIFCDHFLWVLKQSTGFGGARPGLQYV